MNTVLIISIKNMGQLMCFYQQSNENATPFVAVTLILLSNIYAVSTSDKLIFSMTATIST